MKHKTKGPACMLRVFGNLGRKCAEDAHEAGVPKAPLAYQVGKLPI